MNNLFQTPSVVEAFEVLFWGLCTLGIIFMIGSMPWVGPDGIISGGQWLAFSLIPICLFGAGAMCMRFVSSVKFDQADRRLERELRR